MAPHFPHFNNGTPNRTGQPLSMPSNSSSSAVGTGTGNERQPTSVQSHAQSIQALMQLRQFFINQQQNQQPTFTVRPNRRLLRHPLHDSRRSSSDSEPQSPLERRRQSQTPSVEPALRNLNMNDEQESISSSSSSLDNVSHMEEDEEILSIQRQEEEEDDDQSFSSQLRVFNLQQQQLQHQHLQRRLRLRMRGRSSFQSPPLRASLPPAPNPEPNIYSHFRYKIVCQLHCRFCQRLLCQRGMKAILLADTKVELYSTDTPPSQSVQLVNDDYTTQSCHCRIHDVACLGCGNVVGYHVTQPCESCLDACNNGHFWMFQMEGVVSSERMDTSGQKPMMWAFLPSADKDHEGMQLTKIQICCR